MNDFEKMDELNNEQLAYMEQNDSVIGVGKVVKGQIISVNEREAFVNIGYKADGILPKEEVTTDESVKLNDVFKIGDEVEAKVVSRRNEDGYVVLSRIEIEREEGFNAIKEVFENKGTLLVTIKNAVDGGLVGSYKGVRIFIPASHVELNHVKNLEGYVGRELEVNIIEFSKERRNTKIIASRRELLKTVQDKVEEAAWSTIEEGAIVEGEVRRLTDFGAFINVNGIDGLLHISELSWGKISKPGEMLKIGDKIKVFILKADRENKKLSLSIKKLSENPWVNVDEKYPVGSIVLGKVVRFAPFGAFVELEPGVDALVHISQISNSRIKTPAEVLQIGEQIKAKILEVNKEDKKIGLSIKEVLEVE